MTERTFRAPSPNRPGQIFGLEDAPPVPPVPQTYNNDPSQRRAASVEPSMRVASPIPTKKGGRVASLDRAPLSSQKKFQNQYQISPADEDELEDSGSRGSVNFSYPTGARPSSPPALRPLPQSRNQHTNGILQQAATDIQNTLNQTANQPVRKKKKKVARGSAEGSHFASGGTGGKPLGTVVSVLSAEPAKPEQTSSNPAKTKRRQKDHGDLSPRPDAQRETSAYGSDSDSAPDKAKGKRSVRASGLLNKQPSVVREDWEGEKEDSSQLGSGPEQRGDANLSPISSPLNVRKESVVAKASNKTLETSEHSTREARPTSRLITPTPTAAEAPAEASLHRHLEVSEDSARSGRQTSISPSRSTRFSTHLVSEFSGTPRHEPPPRSISPAKSALKHHSPSPQPSSPIDGATAIGWKRGSQASSETSDNASMASTDGFGSITQKKKSARVSFEADPEIVGTAADVTPSDTSIFVSPQHKDLAKKGWLGKSRGGHLDSIPAEDDMEEVMKPRPVLPSFGSVRGRRDVSAEHAVPVTENVSPSSSETSSTSNWATLDTSISSDHAIGSILARESLITDHETKTKLSKPVHAAATLDTLENTDQDLSKRANGTLQSSIGKQSTSSAAPTIPSIAIQPATPGVTEIESRDEWIVEVPGGFPEAYELEGSTPAGQTVGPVLTEDRETGLFSPAEAGISEPKPSELVAAEDPSMPTVGSISETFRQQTEPDSDSESGNSSIYSDAAEDLSDLEGDGFGSINAIVESPVIGVSGTRITTPPESPVMGNVNNGRMGNHTRQGSWEKAGAHWRSVANRHRGAEQDQQRGQDAVQDKPRKKKKTRRVGETMVSAEPQKGSRLVPVSPQGTAPQPSAYPVISKDIVSSGHGGMRRSMRDQTAELANASGFQSSMRTRKSQEPQARDPPPSSRTKGGLQKNKIPASAAASSPPAARKNAKRGPGVSPSTIEPLHRRLCNDSDSSSSFKRSRRPTSSRGKFTMRTSMRSGDDGPTSPAASASPGIRSLSPQNRRPFSPMGQGTLRTSMRGSGDAGGPSLRKQDQQRPSSTVSGFGKARSKGKTVPSKRVAPMLKSRFADSDEDRSGPRTFRSRFEDSSDDEHGVIKYRPARGILGKLDQEDSTDLEDSSDDGEKQTAKSRRQRPKSPEAVKGVRTKVAIEPNVSSPAARPMSPTDGKKKGIFGRFRSKKVKESTQDPQLGNAEREEHDEETRPELEGARSPEMTASPDSRGKLQRKHIPRRMASDTWPLPTKSAPNDDDRPKTSEGTGSMEGAKGRPDLGTRQDTSGTVRTEGGTPVVGRTGKKKRFPKLRRAFGLHD